MPHSVRVQFGLAVSYILLERRDEAVRLLEKLLGSHPDYEPAYRALGECYEDAGNWDALVTLGRKLQGLNRSNALGWYLEGVGLLRNASENELPDPGATAALEHAVTLDRASARMHFALARSYQQANENDLAVRELRETLRLDPRHERAHYVLGRLYQKMGEPERARLELVEHTKIKAEDHNAQYRALVITSRNP